MSVQTDTEENLSLSGVLDFDTVPEIYAQTVGNFPSGQVDLSNVSAVDSAGLALLLEWQATAKADNKILTFINAPSDLIRIAALSEASELLGLAARADSNGEK